MIACVVPGGRWAGANPHDTRRKPNIEEIDNSQSIYGGDVGDTVASILEGVEELEINIPIPLRDAEQGED